MRRNALVLVFALGVVGPASAQSTDAIPRDVVMAILRHRPTNGSSEPTITVADKLPDGFDSRVSLPRGSHVIVTLQSGNMVEVIGSTPGDPDSVRMWFADEFERRGYKPAPPGGIPTREPFRAAERSVSFFGYCGQGWHFSASAARQTPGTSEFALQIIAEGCDRGSVYLPQGGSGWSATGFNPPPFPTLYRPRKVEKADKCIIGIESGRSVRQTEETISTTMNPADMLAYYGRQLDSAGWKSEQRLIGAAGSWTKRDSTGRELRTVLTILPSLGGPDCRNVTLTTGDAHR